MVYENLEDLKEEIMDEFKVYNPKMFTEAMMECGYKKTYEWRSEMREKKLARLAISEIKFFLEINELDKETIISKRLDGSVAYVNEEIKNKFFVKYLEKIRLEKEQR